MGRRQKEGALDASVAIVSWFPWWVGVAIAAIAYVVLHRYATMPLPTASTPAEVSKLMEKSIFHGLALAGQYVVPILALFGALTSFVSRRKRAQLVHAASEAPSADALNGISWREFEMLVGEAFRLQGYTVEEVGGGGADGGVDLVLWKDGKSFLVQCKQWKTVVVDVKVVRELYGVMAHHGAAGGFVVTSGRFTSAAVGFARGKAIELLDGEQLHKLIRSVRNEPSQSAAPGLKTRQNAPTAAANPDCPLCGEPMSLRTAKRGVNAGGKFWGCSSYPACRGTRSA